ncbi:MAG: DNA adenine methylase [Planctomycetota bacterium]|nr:DNA adenine methylase [Planctomycetota bacterium]
MSLLRRIVWKVTVSCRTSFFFLSVTVSSKNVIMPLSTSQPTAQFSPLQQIVNVSSVPQRSPFRYPGGKTWLVPHLRRWLASLPDKPKRFIEPFAGGGIAGLTVAFEELAERVILVELDRDVAAVWRTILNEKGSKLADRILCFDLTIENVKRVLTSYNRSLEDRAFAALLRNRVQHGGIMAPGASLMKKGENGNGISSRWYADTLAKRIKAIAEIKKQIEFRNEDGLETIREYARLTDSVFFVDPPYTIAGKRLYRHSEIDHENLFKIMSTVKGDFLITYDNTADVEKWADEYGFEYETVAMKSRQNSNKFELLIGRNLDWARY